MLHYIIKKGEIIEWKCLVNETESKSFGRKRIGKGTEGIVYEAEFLHFKAKFIGNERKSKTFKRKSKNSTFDCHGYGVKSINFDMESKGF